ncbi:anhydro-N-acetylmuramic acid kinase [Microlunatus elymi]|uniref:Anhydro-N-acetylmuramic acid kinase n=1 Tax=Microlunatus elymi TaxID=2596828 RepID=A0A516Q4C1_9ACTN|nr:anhydro-N-acetylmuramic acid kinase [Microlunatus elymi]QDP98061.1 anhydro-N-acetylmuramic acid kinase [Microlunatus elymi]
MSGTSFDGIDAAVAEFDLVGTELSCRPLGLLSRGLSDELRSRIAAVLPPQRTDIAEVCRLDTELGRLFGEVAAEAINTYGDVDLVVSPGQTVFHWVSDGHALGTLQLGAAAWIAEATGTPVLSDLRTRDIARGGQGAPLAPMLDSLLLLEDDVRRGVLNLGGIANLTVRDDDHRVIGYDLGPASALIDLAVSRATGGVERMDTDGVRADRGVVDHELLCRLLDEPYYRTDPPKSTGKELFDADYLSAKVGDHDLGLDDLVGTLTELTAALVGDACSRWQLEELVVSGGGVRNPTMMRRIAALAGTTVVRTSEDFGIPAQAKECYLMALLGFLSWYGLPGTIASATGASSLLGSFTPGARPLQLPAPPPQPPTRLIMRG